MGEHGQIKLIALTFKHRYGVFTPEQDNDKTNVEPVHSYDAFHTRSDMSGVKGIIGMHRFNICLVVVLSLSCRCLVVVLSLSCRCLVVVLSLSCRCLVVVLSLSCRCLVVVLSLSCVLFRCENTITRALGSVCPAYHVSFAVSINRLNVLLIETNRPGCTHDKTTPGRL